MNRTRVCLLSLFIASLALAVLSGCASAPPTTFLALPTADMASPAAAPASAASAVSPVLIVRRVGVPEYLDVSAVRYRADASTLAEWPSTAWAERPAVALTRELVARLRLALPGWTVCDGTCPSGQGGRVVQAEWAPLDYLRAQGTLSAELRYSITNPTAGVDQSAALRTGSQRWSLPVSPDSAAGQARAIASVVDAAAQAIAASAR
ncbi:membrane integrity-associated transporter subunit PqiC [Aquabacterium sp.]|uniref:PqiC family protein n=1 Tax=Aquabacterium sp. TaxID=1872578 RepID=UPI0035B3199E